MIIGSHVSMSGKEMFLGSVKEALSYGANTLMFYTGAPQNTRRKDVSELKIAEGTKLLVENNIDIANLVVHAPYIINLANSVKPETFQLATDFLSAEILRVEAFGINKIVLHPGSHVGEGVEVGINQIVKGLNEVLTSANGPKIALETMAGKGSEVGFTFEQISDIISRVNFNERLSVCFDTCHTHDAGYNIKTDFDGVLNQFDQVIGLDRLDVIHLNDSKNECGARKDRHENIGHGLIGFDALSYIANHDQLITIPKILETPYVGVDGKRDFPPYREEIFMIKNKEFNDQAIIDTIKRFSK